MLQNREINVLGEKSEKILTLLGQGWIPPLPPFLLVKIVFLDIFTIPFVRILDILLAIELNLEICLGKGEW